MIKALSIVAAALLSVSGPTAAQSKNASPEVLDAFGIRRGTVQKLAVPANDRRPFEIRIELGGKQRVLRMRPHSVLSSDFKLVTDDGTTLRTIPTPLEVTYQGEVAGEPVSGVAGSLLDGQFQAHVFIGGSDWTVQPVTDAIGNQPRSAHVAYEQTDILPTNVSCGRHDGHEPPRKFTGGRNTGPQGSVLRECEIALDCNNHYYVRFGSSTTRTFNAATAQINTVDVIYRREVEICYRIPTIIIRTTQVYRNGPQVGCVSGPDLLEEFRDRWNRSHTNVRRDVAHMLSGWGRWSGIIGCAYLSVICHSTRGYAVSRVVNSNAGRNTGLVAHELGHSWSSGHCNSSPPCYIMCSGIGGCARNLTRFSTYAKNRIIPYKNSRSCLSNCCPQASYTYFGRGCKGTGPGDGIPVLTATSGPKLGGALAIRLTNARPRAPAILLHNASTALVDMTRLGAPGCFIYVNNIFLVAGAVTNLSGTANFATLPIPNISSLCGIRFFDQILVVDPANNLGIVFTRRGQPVIGG